MHVLATSVKSKHNFFKGHLHIIYTNEFWDSIVFCIWKKHTTIIVLFKTKMKTTDKLQTSLWLRHYAQFLCESLPSKRDCACTFIIHVAHQSRCIGRLLTNHHPIFRVPTPYLHPPSPPGLIADVILSQLVAMLSRPIVNSGLLFRSLHHYNRLACQRIYWLSCKMTVLSNANLNVAVAYWHRYKCRFVVTAVFAYHSFYDVIFSEKLILWHCYFLIFNKLCITVNFAISVLTVLQLPL